MSEASECDGAAVDELASLVTQASSVMVLTGAGVSTESGLPDYRGPNGLWRNRRFEELASIAMLRAEPVEFWQFYRERLDVLGRAAPNAAHTAIAALQQAGIVDTVATQNVDGLHTQAGSTVLEMHGSLRTSVCLDCGAQISSEEVRTRMDTSADGVPRCECDGVFKPGVVLFGEPLPVDAIEGAFAAAAKAELMVVCGSSLAVTPVGYLPHETWTRGGSVAIINQGLTACDYLATVRIDGRAGVHLELLVQRLGLTD